MENRSPGPLGRGSDFQAWRDAMPMGWMIPVVIPFRGGASSDPLPKRFPE